MANGRKTNFQAEWKKYFFELLVIITGISISFMVQNWREEQAHEKLEIQTLERLLSDLSADSSAMHTEIEALNIVFRGATKILSFQSLDEVKDSLNIFIGSQLNYTVFTKSDIGYQGIMQSGRSDLISNKALMDKIVHQYAVRYTEVDEWGEIDQTLILDQFIPYFNHNFPYIPGFDFVKYWDKLAPIIKGDTFKNMVRSNAQIKYQVVAIYKKNLESVGDLMAAIEEELKKLK